MQPGNSLSYLKFSPALGVCLHSCSLFWSDLLNQAKTTKKCSGNEAVCVFFFFTTVWEPLAENYMLFISKTALRSPYIHWVGWTLLQQNLWEVTHMFMRSWSIIPMRIKKREQTWVEQKVKLARGHWINVASTKPVPNENVQ